MTEERAKDDDFGSTSGWGFCMVDERPTLDASLLGGSSLGSAREVGLLEEIARLDELPAREVWPLSESGSCKCNNFLYNAECKNNRHLRLFGMTGT